jgi:predicted esterase
MKKLPGDTTYNALVSPLRLAFRDYKSEKPVDDKTLEIFLRQYSYDSIPLNATVSVIANIPLCKIEKIDMDAAYNKERLTLYLFLPNNAKPPYQTIVHFPGSEDIDARKFDFNGQLPWIDFIMKSGRAFCYPVLKGTFERGDSLRSDLQNETVFHKNHVIMWEQDISRTLDYLDTRDDIARDKYGYYGFSWGGGIAPIICAVEKRFKAAVLHVGGLMMQKTLPEVDPWNFLPHVKIPVLMLNGKNDTFFPIETSQKPMFQLLGTDQRDKKMVVYEGGHLVPRSELVKESLLWYDKYLGAVK